MRELREKFHLDVKDMKTKLKEFNQNYTFKGNINLKDILLGKAGKSNANKLHYDVSDTILFSKAGSMYFNILS